MKKNNFFTEEELNSLLKRVSIDPRLKGALEIQLENIKTPSIVTLSTFQLAEACNAEDFYTTAEHAEIYFYGRVLSKEEREKTRIRDKISQILRKIK